MDFIDIALYFTYFIFGISVLSVIVLPLYFMFKDVKKAKGSFIAFGFLVVLYLIGYILSDSDLYLKFPEITASVSKQIGGALIMLYIMIVLSLVSIVFYEIKNMLK